MAIRVRPTSEADAEALGTIDAAYAARHGLERAVSVGALRFFGRTEHSFTAELVEAPNAAPRPIGFVLAQAIWSGERPLVLVTRLAADEGATNGGASALLKALVKSAYDAGVYDLLARVPADDTATAEALRGESFAADEQSSFVRVLGSRGSAAMERDAVSSEAHGG